MDFNSIFTFFIVKLHHKIQPAIQQTKKTLGKKDCHDSQFINLAAENNIKNVIAAIPKESPVIQQLLNEHKLKVIGAMYNLSTGKVLFLK